VRIEYPGKVSEAELWDSVAAARPKTKWKVEFGGAGGGAPEGRLLYGDNLPILKHLVENRSAVGKVKVVYIDPPFATRDGMVAYHDLLKGGEFLEFLRKRLIFLREMLADDGSIYVHIDSTIGHYVKVVMDEVFGSECFRNDITRIKCNPKNFARNAYGNIKDTILFYSRKPPNGASDSTTWNSIGCRSPPRKSKNNSRRRTRRAGGTRRPRSTRRARPGTARPGKTGRG
jgi:adenine-specific DNA-methyltransferase